ncbi:MAG: hypothetical protein OES12_03555 [Anaerolineae bacterium]|nr:hypothetical protein [Anaerolineae bacterium]
MARRNTWLLAALGLIGFVIISCGGFPPVAAGEIVRPAVVESTPLTVGAALTPTITRPRATLPSTPEATRTSAPSPTPTPRPALRQLLQGGCCVQPFFSPDSRQVLYLDKPSSEAPTGIYGLDVTDPAATPELMTETIGYRSPDRTVVATIEGNLTRFLEEGTGQSWTADTGGNRPHYAPDGSRIIWSATDLEGPYDRRRSDIWLAELDGNNPQLILSVVGGGFVDWMPDGQHILVLNRADLNAEERTLVLVDLANDQRTDLATEKRLRGVEISPDGSWIAYFLTFADEPEKDGIWVVSADGSERFKLDVPGFGGYRWRDNKTLLLIPMRSSAEESMQLWEVEVEANISRPLSDPTGLSFSISNGDWEVSPDGRHVIFVNSLDQNIWLITLP